MSVNGRGIAARAVHEQLERRLGAFERVPAELELLDLVGDTPRQSAVLGEVDAEGRRFLEHRAAPRLLRDHRVALVADLGRVDVLIRVRGLAHRVDVLAALVRERGLADVRRREGRGDVGDLGDVACDLGEPCQLLLVDDLDPHLELQVGDQRAQVRVAGALTVAVDAALHLDGAGADRGEGCRHRASRSRRGSGCRRRCRIER